MRFDLELEQETRGSAELMRLCSFETGTADELRVMMRVLGYRGGEEELRLAQSYAVSEDPWDRRTAAELFGRLGLDDRAFPRESRQALENLLEDPHEAVVMEALLSLGYREVQDLADLLRQHEHDPRQGVRSYAALGMSGLEDLAVFPSLVRLAEDEDAAVRECALLGVSTFDEIFPAEVEEILWRHLDDPAEIPRAECFEKLAGIFTVIDEERDEEATRPKIERLVLRLLEEWRQHPIHSATLDAAWQLGNRRLRRRLEEIRQQGQAANGADDEAWEWLEQHLKDWEDERE